MMRKIALALTMLATVGLTACGSDTPAAQETPEALCRGQVNDDPAVQEARLALYAGHGQYATARQNLTLALDSAMQKCLTEHGARFRGGVERVLR